jgi:hypothetical protein
MSNYILVVLTSRSENHPHTAPPLARLTSPSFHGKIVTPSDRKQVSVILYFILHAYGIMNVDIFCYIIDQSFRKFYFE